MSREAARPKRQRVLPAALRDEAASATPAAAAAVAAPATSSSKRARKTKASAPALPPEEPTQLYGLYATDFDDYMNGAWYPITFRGFPTVSTLPVDPAATASDASADAAQPADPSAPPKPNSILIRWSSKDAKYEAEELPLMFVRSAAEFLPLTTENMKRPSSHRTLAAARLAVRARSRILVLVSVPHARLAAGKRVLVREVLDGLDFAGNSYWLATIMAPPSLPVPATTKGKKRAAGSMHSMVNVQYLNKMWPQTDVSTDLIYVLKPKTNFTEGLTLVPPPESPAESEDEAEEAEEQGDQTQSDADATEDEHEDTDGDGLAPSEPPASSSAATPTADPPAPTDISAAIVADDTAAATLEPLAPPSPTDGAWPEMQVPPI